MPKRILGPSAASVKRLDLMTLSIVDLESEVEKPANGGTSTRHEDELWPCKDL